MDIDDLEWDEAKRASTLENRGLNFAEATEVFNNIRLTARDMRRDYGEPRSITMGLLRNGTLVVVCHTPRGTKTRIISMRKANARERERFWRRLEQG